MILPQWFTHKNGSVIEFQVTEKDLLIIFLPPSGSSHESLATLVKSEELEFFMKNQKEFIDWIQPKIQKLMAHTSFRLFGNQHKFDYFSTILKNNGLREGLHVTLPAKSTTLFHFLPEEGRIRIQKDASVEIQKNNIQKTRVLVIDDSETIRKLLTHIFQEDPEIECIATIHHPGLALDAIQKYNPDVITLDIHMPDIDGITLLKRFLPRFPIPTVMISSISKEDGTYVLDALEAGAVDYIQKPAANELKILAPIICEKIKAAKFAKLQKTQSIQTMSEQRSTLNSNYGSLDFSYLMAIGASTGGTEAIKEILMQLPEKIPPIVIVQHIPAVFSKAFADRMNQLCPFEVKEAEDHDLVQMNRVFIAPGGKQMYVKLRGNEFRISIDDSAPVNRHKPSVDVLFNSIAELNYPRIVATILTGMGADGAKGLLKLKESGASTFAQDEASSVIYGMPKEAVKLGGVQESVSLNKMAAALIKKCILKEKT